jgi:glucose-6-phosphate 1-dehydrogenase
MSEVGDGARVARSAALVVFGATGDLASRKLYPALTQLAQRNQLPHEFAVVGVARTEMSDEDFAARAPELAARGVSFHYVAGSFDEPETFVRLREALEVCDVKSARPGTGILPRPGALRSPGGKATGGGRADRAARRSGTSSSRKPFGRDLASRAR